MASRACHILDYTCINCIVTSQWSIRCTNQYSLRFLKSLRAFRRILNRFILTSGVGKRSATAAVASGRRSGGHNLETYLPMVARRYLIDPQGIHRDENIAEGYDREMETRSRAARRSSSRGHEGSLDPTRRSHTEIAHHDRSTAMSGDFMAVDVDDMGTIRRGDRRFLPAFATYGGVCCRSRASSVTGDFGRS